MASYPAYDQPQNNLNDGYPPHAQDYNNFNSSHFNVNKGPDDNRRISRTPSPTPSEEAELENGMVDWKTLTNTRFWIRREWIWYYVIIAVLVALTTLMTIYHKQIVHWLEPAANWMHNLKDGWLVPIGILFVISFPPLFGHEIVAVLCGVVWGLWIGFAIVVAGSFLGEVGNFYAFKYFFRARAERMEKTSFFYAELAQVVREGGFRIALIARLSAIPGHFTTAMFATCGMHILTFCIAAILSSPKQFITVYLGVILDASGTGTTSTKSRIISDSVVALTIIITGVAMWYILHEMHKVKPAIVYARRKARQVEAGSVGHTPYNNLEAGESDMSVFNPSGSESEVPLTSTHQQWNKEGRAVGFSGDPRLVAPQPQRPPQLPAYDGGDYGNSRVQSPQRQGTAGWDMRPSSKERQATTSSSPQKFAPLQNTKYPSNTPSMPAPVQNSALHQTAELIPTPTDAQFVTVAYNAGPSPLTSAPLPTPSYPSPFDDAYAADSFHATEPSEDSYYTHHAAEPTGATYRTAHSVGTEYSEYAPDHR